MQYLRIPIVQIYIPHTHMDDTNHEIGMSILRTYFPIMDSFRQMQNMDLGNINLYVSTFLNLKISQKQKLRNRFGGTKCTACTVLRHDTILVFGTIYI